MSRTKSHSSHATNGSRRTNNAKTTADRKPSRPQDPSTIRRYLEFVRAVVGQPTRHGR